MKIIYKEPFKNLIEKEIEDRTGYYKNIIKDMLRGDFDHLWLPHNIKLLRNADGKLLNLHPNIPVNHDLILGNVIFIGSDIEGNFTSLSELQAAYIKKNYN